MMLWSPPLQGEGWVGMASNARTTHLERFGSIVPGFWNIEVFDNIEGVVEVILSTLSQQATPSPPNPRLEAEG